MYRVNLKLNSLLDGAKVKDGCLGSEPPAETHVEMRKVYHVDVISQFLSPIARNLLVVSSNKNTIYSSRIEGLKLYHETPMHE